MKVYESKAIRNVGIVGHGHCGKTSLTAALLFTTGGSSRLLRVDEGNTLTDFDEEEVQLSEELEMFSRAALRDAHVTRVQGPCRARGLPHWVTRRVRTRTPSPSRLLSVG